MLALRFWLSFLVPSQPCLFSTYIIAFSHALSYAFVTPRKVMYVFLFSCLFVLISFFPMVLVSVVQVSLFLLLVRCLFLSLLDLCCGGVFNLLVPPASASLSTFCLINSAPPPGKISFRPSPSSLPPAPLPTVPSLPPPPPLPPAPSSMPHLHLGSIHSINSPPPQVKFPSALPLPPSFQGSFLDLIPYPFSLWSMDDNGVVRLGG